MKLKKVVLAMGLLSLVAGHSAFAEDGKVHPGNMCTPTLGSQWSNFTSTIGRLFNTFGSSRLTVICPIVRDNVTNSNGTNRVMVKVIGSGVSCKLGSRDAFGNIIEDTGFKTNFSSSGEITLDVNRSVSSGYYFLQCELPRNTGIASYRADEP